MNNTRNQRIYRMWAPVYDRFFDPIFAGSRRQAIELLALMPGERLLIPGAGTGLDIPLLPASVVAVVGDLSLPMLSRAQVRTTSRFVALVRLDAQKLPLPDSTFDAALLNLIVSVVPDGAAAFAEAWRVLRPGGRIVIFDKFLPEKGELSLGRRIFGRIMSVLGTDPNRRLSQITGSAGGVVIEREEAGLGGGTYRTLLLRKWE